MRPRIREKPREWYNTQVDPFVTSGDTADGENLRRSRRHVLDYILYRKQ